MPSSGWAPKPRASSRRGAGARGRPPGTLRRGDHWRRRGGQALPGHRAAHRQAVRAANPVASDLRLLTALLHINLHLERIADQAVNLAKLAKLVHGLPQNPKVLRRLEE